MICFADEGFMKPVDAALCFQIFTLLHLFASHYTPWHEKEQSEMLLLPVQSNSDDCVKGDHRMISITI